MNLGCTWSLKLHHIFHFLREIAPSANSFETTQYFVELFGCMQFTWGLLQFYQVVLWKMFLWPWRRLVDYPAICTRHMVHYVSVRQWCLTFLHLQLQFCSTSCSFRLWNRFSTLFEYSIFLLAMTIVFLHCEHFSRCFSWKNCFITKRSQTLSKIK